MPKEVSEALGTIDDMESFCTCSLKQKKYKDAGKSK